MCVRGAGEGDMCEGMHVRGACVRGCVDVCEVCM